MYHPKETTGNKNYYKAKNYSFYSFHFFLCFSLDGSADTDLHIFALKYTYIHEYYSFSHQAPSMRRTNSLQRLRLYELPKWCSSRSRENQSLEWKSTRITTTRIEQFHFGANYWCAFATSMYTQFWKKLRNWPFKYFETGNGSENPEITVYNLFFYLLLLI